MDTDGGRLRPSADAIAACTHPVRWGVDDCAPWAADRLRDAGCGDFFAPWRGRYADNAGRDAVLAAEGGLARAVLRAMRGQRRVDPASAVPPAAALVRVGEGRDSALVCAVAWAPGWFVLRGPGAAVFVPPDRVARCWQF